MPPAKKTEPELRLQPTPRIGQMLQYFRDEQNLEDPAACVCTAVENPGKIQVAIINPNSTMFNVKKGVHWAGNDDRLLPGRPFRLNGVWDFIPGQTPRDALKYHKDLLDRRAKDQEARDRQDELLRAQREQRHREMQETVKGTD